MAARAFAVVVALFAVLSRGDADVAAPVRELRFDELLRFTPPESDVEPPYDYWVPDGPPPRVPDELLVQGLHLWPVHDVSPIDWGLAALGQAVRFDGGFVLDSRSVRLLAWRIVVDDRPLRIECALIWARGRAADGSERWGLASVYRHPNDENEWRRPWMSHTPLVSMTTHERRPTHSEVLDLVSSSYWLFDSSGTHQYQPSSGWVVEGAGLNRAAWDECFGGLPAGVE